MTIITNLSLEALPPHIQALVRTSLTSETAHDAVILDKFLDAHPHLKPLAMFLAFTYFKPFEVQHEFQV